MNTSNASATYDQALEQHYANDRAIVLDGQVQAGLHYDGRPICSVLRPVLLDAAEKAGRDQASELVARGVRLAVEAAAKEPALRKALLLTDAEEECVRYEGGATGELFARLDGLVDGSGALRFLEYNPFPSGFAWADKVADRFEATAAYAACAARFPLIYERMIPRFANALLSHMAHLPAEGPRTVGIVAPPSGSQSVDAAPEIALVLETLFRAGIQVRLADAEGLSRAGEALCVGGGRVDAVFVTHWDPFLSTEARRSSPLWQAHRAGSVVLVDSPASSALHGAKAIFALLSDPHYAQLFPSDVRAALLRHVPWTRAVVDGPSSYRGEPIALLPFLRARQKELVLKPAHAHGGAGVVLGWECSESTWDDALATALGTPYVAQERAFGDTTSHPVAGPDGPVQQTLLYDWNPFVWNDGRAFGAIARLGQQSILNVMAGASLVPVFSAAEQSR